MFKIQNVPFTSNFKIEALTGLVGTETSTGPNWPDSQTCGCWPSRGITCMAHAGYVAQFEPSSEDRLAALERRIAELEKRVKEAESGIRNVNDRLDCELGQGDYD